MDNLERFINRISKLGIEIELDANIPWVYVKTINNKKVTEKSKSEYGFVIGYLPIRNNEDFVFSDLNEFIQLIRKYEK